MRQTRRADETRRKTGPPIRADRPFVSRSIPPRHAPDDLFSSAIEAIYNASVDPQSWPSALQAIADFFGDVGAILLWRRDDGSFGSVASPGVLEAQKDWEQGGWNIHDLRPLRAAERGYFFSGAPFTDRHLFSDEEIRTCPSYTEFQAQHDLGWFGAVAVSPDPNIGVVLSVHRCARKRPPFSDAELAVLARLGRHVERSLRLSIRLFDAELLKLGLGEALTRVGIGVFALDSSGRVIFVNSAGRSLVGDGLFLVKDRLLARSKVERFALETAIQKIIRPAAETVDEHKPVILRRREDKRPLALYVLPITPPSHPAAQFLIHACAIALVIDPEAGEPADPTLLRDILGLTLGEARIAALVGSGLSPREAAKKLGITEETARAVLKHVFSKTGVSRQGELVALLSKMVLH
jgi:DNA-binding CsgD family transcriptional regulator/PAS domain-containing protein